MNTDQPPIRFSGPWLGLNTTLDPRQLPPGAATVATNVWLHRGRIQPRPPIQPWRTTGMDLGDEIFSIFQWEKNHEYTPGFTSDLVTLAKTQGGELYAVYRGFAPVLLASGLSTQYPGDYVIVGNWCYLLDGSDTIYKTQGTPATTFPVGLAGIADWIAEFKTDAPFTGNEDISLEEWGGGYPTAGSNLTPDLKYQYAFTLYHPVSQTESAGCISNELLVTGSPANPPTVEIIINKQSKALPALSGLKFRVYRRVVDTSPGFRLIAEIDADETSPTAKFYDRMADDDFGANQDGGSYTTGGTTTDYQASNYVIGPFYPIRTAAPPGKPTKGEYYQGRLWCDSLDNPGKVFYSEIDSPDWFGGGNNYENIEGDSAGLITGIRELQGQLLVGKRTGLWSIAGVVATNDRNSAALGIPDPESGHQLVRLPGRVGPCTWTTNGLISIGANAPEIFAVCEEGLLALDGSGARQTTVAIVPTWASFIHPVGFIPDRALITHAVDTQNQLLVLANFRGNPGCLAYHWGTGTWAEYTGIKVVGTAIGLATQGEGSLVDISFLSASGAIAGAVDFCGAWGNTSTAAAVDFEYITGELELLLGTDALFYWLRVFVDRLASYQGDRPDLEISWRTPDGAWSTKTIDPTTQDRARIAPKRWGRALQLRFKKAAAWTLGYQQEGGIIGYDLDPEATIAK